MGRKRRNHVIRLAKLRRQTEEKLKTAIEKPVEAPTIDLSSQSKVEHTPEPKTSSKPKLEAADKPKPKTRQRRTTTKKKTTLSKTEKKPASTTRRRRSTKKTKEKVNDQ
jgi:hypothetical protein